MTDDLISRQAAIEAVIAEGRTVDSRYLESERIVHESDAVEAISMLPSAEPRWIPVTERLPEYGIEVVTVDKDGDYEINHIIDKEDGKWYWRGTIAWMPLPEPWRGEDDETD